MWVGGTVRFYWRSKVMLLYSEVSVGLIQITLSSNKEGSWLRFVRCLDFHMPMQSQPIATIFELVFRAYPSYTTFCNKICQLVFNGSPISFANANDHLEITKKLLNMSSSSQNLNPDELFPFFFFTNSFDNTFCHTADPASLTYEQGI